jgi:predicted RNA binding protein YcfA (HicA-like mRNA interferase family)
MAKEQINLNVSYRELVKMIEAKGWQKDRSSKHILYIHQENTQKIVIPHKKLSPGIVRKIINLVNGQYYGGNFRKEF